MPSPTEKTCLTQTLVASEALSDYQYHGMTISGDRTVDLFDADADIPCGVLLNDPANGQEALICVLGIVPVVLGENSVTAGKLLRFDGSTGHAMMFDVDTDVTTYCAGQFLEGGDSGEVVNAMINGINPWRGEE